MSNEHETRHEGDEDRSERETISEPPRQPLSDERLAEIRDAVDWSQRADNGAYAAKLAGMADELLAELDRLRAAFEVQAEATRRENARAEKAMEARASLSESNSELYVDFVATQRRLDKALETVRVVAEATTTWTSRDDYAASSALVYPGRETSRQLRDKARAVLAAQVRGKAAEPEPDSGEPA